jgi:formylglycine-generating enzyme required for sulfatase activity
VRQTRDVKSPDVGHWRHALFHGNSPCNASDNFCAVHRLAFEKLKGFGSFAMGRFSFIRTLIFAAGLTLLSARAATAPKPAVQVIADLQLELLWVEPGTFTMGSSADEPERNKAEGPQTRVTLTHGFWLGKTEVTQAQYEAVTGANPSTFKAAGPNAPVERVSWIDAMAFCEKLNARERAAGRLPAGYSYTLPTEAQWEYAYRAGTTGIYPVEPNASAWFANNSGETTHPVGTKQANAWGFYDMAGNVLEWCFDWYGDYPGGAVNDWSGPSHGYYRMARGGSWRTDAKQGRAAARGGGSAGRLDYTLGFRLALCATPTP